MEHFEDELKIALTRLKRTELKAILQKHDDTSFEAETADAFKSLEKKRLKMLLVEHTTEEKTEKNTFTGYWKYAAVACVFFGIGLFIYTNNNDTRDNVVLNKPKTSTTSIEIKSEKTKVKKPIESKNQILESKVFVEEIGQMGFASNKPFDLKFFVNPERKGLRYKLHQNVLEIESDKKIEVKIFHLQEQYYFKVNQKVYLLSVNDDFETPIEVFDNEILDLIP